MGQRTSIFDCRFDTNKPIPFRVVVGSAVWILMLFIIVVLFQAAFTSIFNILWPSNEPDFDIDEVVGQFTIAVATWGAVVIMYLLSKLKQFWRWLPPQD